jgi:phospholipid transport system substrate-binding protein
MNKVMYRNHLIAAVLILAPAIASAETAQDPASQRVDAYHQSVIAVMKQGPKLGMSGRVEKFLPIVRTYYDIPGMTALIVGPKWATTSAADRTAAIDAVARHSAVSHSTNFKSYDGDQFRTDPTATTRGSDKLVRASIGSTKLSYRLRQSGGSWKILDVYSDGVSNLNVQRSDFSSAIASGGAAALTKRLTDLDAKNSK